MYNFGFASSFHFSRASTVVYALLAFSFAIVASFPPRDFLLLPFPLHCLPRSLLFCLLQQEGAAKKNKLMAVLEGTKLRFPHLGKEC